MSRQTLWIGVLACISFFLGGTSGDARQLQQKAGSCEQEKARTEEKDPDKAKPPKKKILGACYYITRRRKFCEVTTKAACLARKGKWVRGQKCKPKSPIKNLGRCVYRRDNKLYCRNTRRKTCLALKGTWTRGKLCVPTPPAATRPAPAGACHYHDGGRNRCLYATKEHCRELKGVWAEGKHCGHTYPP